MVPIILFIVLAVMWVLLAVPRQREARRHNAVMSSLVIGDEVMTGGGLRLRTRDLATVARMLLAHGAWNGAQVVSAAFVDAALTQQRDAMPEQNYGYLFWTRRYKTPCGTTTGWFMSGNGGNAVVMFRELDAVVVVTRTHYNSPGMHQQTARLIEDQILPQLACK